jgi:hypothetical protein
MILHRPIYVFNCFNPSLIITVDNYLPLKYNMEPYSVKYQFYHYFSLSQERSFSKLHRGKIKTEKRI